MENFVYFNPTRIVFGEGTIAQLRSLVPASAKVMVTYGGGSVKRNGVYAQVCAALADHEVIEFGGIQPNPTYEKAMEAVALVPAESVTFLLAVGGGSVVDATKFIAAACHYEGEDPWDLLVHRGVVTVPSATPLGVVLTLPATGSESNPFAVVSRASTGEKLAFDSEHIIPRFAVLDPSTTYSLDTAQVRNGIVDSFVHVIEQYATYPCAAPLQDRQAEAILATLIEEGPKALHARRDYASRANLMWCATQALNRLINCGVPRDFATHLIGHELTALYGLVHAESLAAVLPSLLRHQRQAKREKLLQYARRVWQTVRPDADAAIESGISRTVSFFEALGMPTSLGAHGIDAGEAAERVSERLTRRGVLLGERKSISPEQVAEILRCS